MNSANQQEFTNRTLHELAQRYMDSLQVRHAAKPKTVEFYSRELARPFPQRVSSDLENVGGVCVTLPETYLRNSSWRIWSRRFYDHEVDGTFQRYCISEVRAPCAARRGGTARDESEGRRKPPWARETAATRYSFRYTS